VSGLVPAADWSPLCAELERGLVSDLMEGTLDRAARPFVVAHLRVCAACSSLLSRMRVVVRLVGRATRGAQVGHADEAADDAVLDLCLPLLELRRLDPLE
jgi:anti-sigma factor ChrR (cupin superfamily)